MRKEVDYREASALNITYSFITCPEKDHLTDAGDGRLGEGGAAPTPAPASKRQVHDGRARG